MSLNEKTLVDERYSVDKHLESATSCFEGKTRSGASCSLDSLENSEAGALSIPKGEVDHHDQGMSKDEIDQFLAVMSSYYNGRSSSNSGILPTSFVEQTLESLENLVAAAATYQVWNTRTNHRHPVSFYEHKFWVTKGDRPTDP